MNITADHAQVPVSASNYVFDDAHRNTYDQDLQPLRKFSIVRTHCALLWGALPLGTSDWDVSDELDALVAAAGGEAITNFVVDAETYPSNNVPILNMLPVWPVCGTFTVSGKVMRRYQMVPP
jgi:hypothetical protein